jgi:hypothetical protein
MSLIIRGGFCSYGTYFPSDTAIRGDGALPQNPMKYQIFFNFHNQPSLLLQQTKQDETTGEKSQQTNVEPVCEYLVVGMYKKARNDIGKNHGKGNGATTSNTLGMKLTSPRKSMLLRKFFSRLEEIVCWRIISFLRIGFL